MAWTTPKTWVDGELVAASELNIDNRDNMNYLYPFADGKRDVAFDAARYTTNGGGFTWTVDSGDVLGEWYTIYGSQFTYHVMLMNTALGGSANFQLNIALPDLVTSLKVAWFVNAWAFINGAFGNLLAWLNGTQISMIKDVGGNFTVPDAGFWVYLTMHGVVQRP